MFHKRIVESDLFLDMPDSTQNLYFHLSMCADDDGFVDKPKSIMRMTGKKEDDLKLLITKQFILPFESGVIVIKHWRINNYLRSDRYKETNYKAEKAQLSINKNGEYEFGIPSGIPLVDQVSPSDLDLDLDLDSLLTNINKKTSECARTHEEDVDNSIFDAFKEKFKKFYEYQKTPQYIQIADDVIYCLVDLSKKEELAYKGKTYTHEEVEEIINKLDLDFFIKIVSTISLKGNIENKTYYVWGMLFNQFEGVANE